MIEELDILKIVKEDILKLLAETKKKVSPKFLKEEIKVSFSFIAKAVEILKNEGLILIEKEIISLTKNGLTEAKKIIKRHLFLENYFKDKKSKEEVHLMAELLEHYITEEVANNIKKFSTLKKERTESFLLVWSGNLF